MASGFQPPMLIWSSDNLSDAFRSFEQYCSLIFEGPFSAKTEKEKVTYFLLWIGHHGLDVYDSFQWDDDTDRYKLAPVWKKFQDHIQPKVNLWFARYSLQQCKQAQHESVDEFISHCRTQAAKCKFSKQAETETQLVEQLIVGTRHTEVQEKLLEKGDSLSSFGIGNCQDIWSNQRPASQVADQDRCARHPHSRIRVKVWEMWHTPCQVMGRLTRQG